MLNRTNIPKAHQMKRQKIESDVQTFLDSGKNIETLKSGIQSTKDQSHRAAQKRRLEKLKKQGKA